MANKVSDTLKELKAISSKIESIRTESRRFLDNQEREMQAIQGRINVLCSSLVESDSMALGTNQFSIGFKRQNPEMGVSDFKTEHKRVKTESSSIGRSDFIVQDGYTQVWTDGACPNNGKGAARAGIGVYWGPNHKLNLSQRVAGERQTNNVAEIEAATMSVSQALGAEISLLQVNTDSQFLINCVTNWMKNWKRNGWKTATGQEVKNKPELVELDKLLQRGSIQVKWNHVKGHSDNKGNIEADRLAVEGANK